MDMQAAVECYRKHKHLKNAADELGVPWQTLYVWLRKEGEPVTGDKKRYGSDKDRLAARAEELFKKLVPFAEDANQSSYQPKIDFSVSGYGVDIKSSNRRPSDGRWSFSVKKQSIVADFFVCFGFDGSNAEIILLIPGEIARYYSSISLKDGGKWRDYAVSPRDLGEFFSALPPKDKTED